MLGTFIGWRPVFGLLIAVAAIVFLLSFKLKPAQGRPEVRIDLVGAVLAAVSIILISLGFNNLNRWGLGVVRPGAPFDLFGFSPAPVMIVIGIVLLQAFIMWTRRQQNAAPRPARHHLQSGAGGGDLHVLGRPARGDAELLR